jgi:hypothetical protein
MAAALLAAALASMIGGCVVAALPLAAGAALAKRHSDLESAHIEHSAPAAATPVTGEARPALTLTALTALPPPDHAARPDDIAVAAFAKYAIAQGQTTSASTRLSAILPSASALRVARTACGALPAAVIVDLDPGRATFDPLSPGTANAALREHLTSLRENQIAVVWVSRLSVNFASAVRRSLAESGLDPQGADRLLLLPDLAERKQSLRDQVAKTLCPVAMLGDERADFDELYLYLKRPEAAVELDAMLGKGWFLAAPFAAPTARSTASGAPGAPPTAHELH